MNTCKPIPTSKLITGSLAFLMLATCIAAYAQDEEEALSGGGDVLSVPFELTAQKLREARSKGYSVTLGGGVVGGYESNVHRSPDGDESTSSLLGLGGLMKADKRFSAGRRLQFELSRQGFTYSSESDADVVRWETGAEYEQEIRDDLKFSVAGSLKNKSDSSTDIFGEPYERDFSYSTTDLDGRLDWDLSREHRFTAGTAILNKDYGETSDLGSIDWSKWSWIARYRWRIAKRQSLRIWLERGIQTYDEEPANSLDGSESSSNPNEEHTRQKVLVWYSHPFGERVRWNVKAGHRTKEDEFEDYESYSATKLETGLSVGLLNGTLASADISFEKKDYKNIPDEDTGTLEIDRVLLNIGLSRKLYSNVWGNASYSFVSRNTNRDTGSVYRDYEDHALTIGVGTYF